MKEQQGNSVSQTSDQRQMATLKNLKTKTGICQRTLKELHSYESEVEQESAKTISMKESNADAFDIKQQVLSVSPFVLCELNALDLLQHMNA
jgi:hypothetical protein